MKDLFIYSALFLHCFLYFLLSGSCWGGQVIALKQLQCSFGWWLHLAQASVVNSIILWAMMICLWFVFVVFLGLFGGCFEEKNLEGLQILWFALRSSSASIFISSKEWWTPPPATVSPKYHFPLGFLKYLLPWSIQIFLRYFTIWCLRSISLDVIIAESLK